MPIKTQQDEQPTLNLTPMIDVVFLLIIFFMVATKFSEMERDIELELPEVASAKALTDAPKQRIVSVRKDGQLALDQEEVSLEQLKNRLAAAQREYPELSVVIRGDATSAFQHVAGALAACKEANITDLGITVKIAEAKRGKQR
ncbi:MAG: biopolymer transporter ExbD [Planctomycetes bacterium]|nr:biopolymer transporter ExbD [Planctomycetota bacterium]